jgi:AcrR family transcriptional regulator
MAPDDEHRRGDTRHRIQAVAIELFAQQGYEKTSLREIADRLGVTKAALYYHFKTKEDIVSSLFTDFFADVDEIIAWAREQPRTRQTRREIIRRYDGVLAGGRAEMFKFMQESQHSMRDLSIGPQAMVRIRTLAGLLTEPDAPPSQHLKALLALIALQMGRFAPSGLTQDVDPEARRAAALDVALELASG